MAGPVGIPLEAVEIPLRGGWLLELRRKGCTQFCQEVTGLPEGWAGAPSDSHAAPIRWRRVMRGPALRLHETVSFLWEIRSQNGGSPCGPFPELHGSSLFTRNSRDGVPPQGELSLVNYLGMVPFQVRRGSEVQDLMIEVISTKFQHDDDYRRMTEDIARHCQQLLLDWNSPAGVPFTPDPEQRRRLLLEQFLYLKDTLTGGRLEMWIEAVRRRPHTRLTGETNWRSAALVRGNDYLSRPHQNGRDWMRTSDGRLRPAELLSVRKFDDIDTPPNQFLRHAMGRFASVCREVMQLFPPDGGPACAEAASLLSVIEGILGGALFREISEPRRLALENQTLQKREGYRDILRIWLLLEQAARLDWEGRNDVFNGTVRNVANLYEYWLFFVMHNALKCIDGMTGIQWRADELSPLLPAFCQQEGKMRINLKRGQGSLVIFEYSSGSGEPLRLHFCFDRSYSPTGGDVLAGGAYSHRFRPDFSLVIFPAGYAEGKSPVKAEASAERDGRIAYLHFDAKYRVDDLREIFGDDAPGELDEEEIAKTTNTYKRADLYKMHAYNDAIRRTVGSFVLYPGNDGRVTKYPKYHELLPGLGAFAVGPGSGEGEHRLRNFLEDVLREQRNRFSQLTRVNYWTHDTVKEQPSEYVTTGSNVMAHLGKPPADENIVLVPLRSRAWMKLASKHGFVWFHALNSAGEPVRHDPAMFTSDLVLPICGGKPSGSMRKVIKYHLWQRETLAKNLGLNFKRPKRLSVSHYHVLELGDAVHCESARLPSELLPLLLRGQPRVVKVGRLFEAAPVK
jgi:predicted component of viral defense system (DUF524 family)